MEKRELILDEILPEITTEKRNKYIEAASSYGDLEGLEKDTIVGVINDAYYKYLQIGVEETHRLLTYRS